MDQPDPIAWAKTEVARLRDFARQGSPPRVTEVTGRAVQFLMEFAPGTIFLERAERAFRHYTSESQAINDVAQQLEEWVAYQESGLPALKPFEVRFRIEASTDLMEQVQLLLKDKDVHPAAPIVLAGAALEEFLRSMFEDSGEPLVGKPGISSYAEALKKSELLSRSDAKDITAWADQRNDAAHGRFDDLTRDRAQIMVDGVNLFIRRHSE